jgi:single-strand DNA-binding protein
MVIGHLGKDPEVKKVGEQSVCNFTMATSEKWTKDGEEKEKTEWHRITVWGKLADLCGTYLKKGRQAYVEGKLQTRSYDKDGVTMYTTEIIASNVQFLGGATTSETDTLPAATTERTATATTTTPAKKVKNFAPGADNSHLDELPF